MNERVSSPLPPKLPGPSDGLSIGLIGGSFDPPHAGHVHVIRTAQTRIGLDWVWAIPARGNPLKKTQTPFAKRMDLAREMFTGPRARVTPLEHDLGLTYTVDVIAALQRRAPGARFVWIMGADSLQSFHRWRNWRQIADMVPIAVISRPGAFPSAGLSRLAKTYSASRIPQGEAGALAYLKPPAWTLIKAPHAPQSSTAIRNARGLERS